MARTYKRTVYKRPYKKKVDTVKELNKKVNKLAKELKPELKLADSTVESMQLRWPDITNTGQFLTMILPDPTLTPGFSYSKNRIGDKILIRHIDISGYVYTKDLDARQVRIMLIRWNNSSAAGISSVIANINEGFCTFAPRNSIYDQQYSVLFDKRLTLYSGAYNEKQFSYKKWCMYPVNYVADSTSIADGSLVLYAFSDAGTASPVNAPTINLFARIQYSDI